MILDFLKKISIEDQITTHFRFKDALFLASWQMYAFPPDEQTKYNIFSVSMKLEEIRALFGDRQIFVTSWYRPKVYDNFIKKKDLFFNSVSKHTLGKAVDFNVFGIEPKAVQAKILENIDRLQVRLELNTPSWTHIDLDYKPNQNNTFFG